jgi:hypothetical protein
MNGRLAVLSGTAFAGVVLAVWFAEFAGVRNSPTADFGPSSGASAAVIAQVAGETPSNASALRAVAPATATASAQVQSAGRGNDVRHRGDEQERDD